ncbi:MAG: M13 family metallopeptidase [Saprospiraceae bacterium]
MNIKMYIVSALVSTLCILSCAPKSTNPLAEVEKIPGIALENMDTNVKPNEDFFRFVNGKWYDKTEIPDDRASWGGFNELRKKTDGDALAILKATMSDDKDIRINVIAGSDQEKAVNLFQTIMDTTSRNEHGIKPLLPYLANIESIKGIGGLQDYMIKMADKGGLGFFGLGVGAHPKNSNLNTAYLGSAGLGLPDRDYYLKDDNDSKEKREKYQQFVSNMFQYFGDSETEANSSAADILAFETEIAESKMDKVDRRDARKRFNPRSIADLNKMVPAMDWKKYFSGIGVPEIDTVIVPELKYMDAIQKILARGEVGRWKNYLRWEAINGAAGMLNQDLEKTNWEFYSKDLRGSKKQRPADERALGTMNRTIGEALGKLYVDRKFPPEAKKRAESMIADVILAFEQRINNLDWMSAETKIKAVEKLKALKVKIAYPDEWKDYATLDIKGVEEGGSYLQNMMNATAWNYAKSLDKLGKEVDKSEWFMAPQIVNAYFNPRFNEIVFPAAILQPPFFNFNADDAVNYGGIGAVIGHEISHCFDDSGSRYDKDGNLNNWWTDEDLKKFEELGKNLADQYSAIEVLPETNINGAFTLGENIGDLGGVLAAYSALQINYNRGGRPEAIDGFTPEQRFFMSWGTIWRTKSREDAIKTQVKTDPHSPGATRAVQPLLNIDEFYAAFDIKEGDKMYIKPEERVRIW